MHPFLPIVTVVLHAMAALLTWHLFRYIRPDPLLLPHQDMFWVPIGFSLFFGLPLALWLWTKGLRYPLLTSLAIGIILGLALRFFP